MSSDKLLNIVERVAARALPHLSDVFGWRKMKRFLPLLLLALLPCTTFSGPTEEGIVIVYSGLDDYGYSLRAPPGWVSDIGNVGVNQRSDIVFYQVGHRNWQDATVIAFIQVVRKDEVVKNIPSLIQSIIEDFRKSGNANFQGIFVKKIKTSDGQRTAHIYLFEGDSWGNYVAVGCLEEANEINVITLSSGIKDELTSALPAFESLLTSYNFKPLK